MNTHYYHLYNKEKEALLCLSNINDFKIVGGVARDKYLEIQFSFNKKINIGDFFYFGVTIYYDCGTIPGRSKGNYPTIFNNIHSFTSESKGNTYLYKVRIEKNII